MEKEVKTVNGIEFAIGDKVRVRDNPGAGTANIQRFTKRLVNAVMLSTRLNGFLCWNLEELEKVSLEN